MNAELQISMYFFMHVHMYACAHCIYLYTDLHCVYNMYDEYVGAIIRVVFLVMHRPFSLHKRYEFTFLEYFSLNLSLNYDYIQHMNII